MVLYWVAIRKNQNIKYVKLDIFHRLCLFAWLHRKGVKPKPFFLLIGPNISSEMNNQFLWNL